MADFILALDQGTSSSRAILFDGGGNIVSISQREYPISYPQPGWVEQSAEDIWQTQSYVARDALNKIGARAEQVAAIGISNQRETTIVWDKSGTPIYPAIVWQDRRTAGICDELRAAGLEPMFRERTGLLLDPYFSGTKVKWLLDNVPGARERAERGELMFGTVDTWLLYKLCGDARHRLLERLADAALQRLRPALGRRAAHCARCAGVDAADGAGVVRRLRRDDVARHAARRLREWREISRPRSSGRRASSRAWRRTRTAPAPSCC